MDDSGSVLLYFLGAGAVIFLLVWFIRKAQNSSEATREVVKFYNNMWTFANDTYENFGLICLEKNDNAINLPVVLSKNEYLLFSQTLGVVYSEERSTGRNYGGLGFRVAKGVSVYMGRSVSTRQMTVLDRGLLFLTNKRLVFVGGKQHQEIKLVQITSLDFSDNQLFVTKSGKSKTMQFQGVGANVFGLITKNLLSHDDWEYVRLNNGQLNGLAYKGSSAYNSAHGVASPPKDDTIKQTGDDVTLKPIWKEDDSSIKTMLKIMAHLCLVGKDKKDLKGEIEIAESCLAVLVGKEGDRKTSTDTCNEMFDSALNFLANNKDSFDVDAALKRLAASADEDTKKLAFEFCLYLSNTDEHLKNIRLQFCEKLSKVLGINVEYAEGIKEKVAKWFKNNYSCNVDDVSNP